MNRFDARLHAHGLAPLSRAPLSELQVNLGRLCNQACAHCHVDAGPKRTEVMRRETLDRILDWVAANGIRHVDVTGGAPELNPGFRPFVDGLIARGARVTARCNLTVVHEAGCDDLPAWYASRRVRVVASLPCYTEKNVDAQRGRGVFSKSVAALRQLNRAGYARRDDLVLDLVYNPGGAFLPPSQAKLEADYRARLASDFGVEFSRLLALANLPINRFAHALERDGHLGTYLQLLSDRFNPDTVPGLMCRHLISVDWQGRVYDCDFNQMLELPPGGGTRFLWDLTPAMLEGTRISTGDHCLGCTAGAGSSCAGALAA